MARKLLFDPKTLGSLTIGLDIGIASVGWAILSPKRIVDLGVRCFDAAEESKTKVSFNQGRRTARVGRNRNFSRRSRLKRLSELFVNIGLLSAPTCALLFASIQAKKTKDAPATTDIWELRATIAQLASQFELHPNQSVAIRGERGSYNVFQRWVPQEHGTNAPPLTMPL